MGIVNNNGFVGFCTPISYEGGLLEAIDSYFVSSATYTCARVITASKIQNNTFSVSMETQSQSALKCWIKRISYLTVIIPIVMLVAKGIFRLCYAFKDNESNIVKLNLAVKQLTILKKEDSTLQNTIGKVETILGYRDLAVVECFENHALHDAVTDITHKVRTDEKLKKIWTVFLDAVDKLELVYPNGDSMPLDFSPEKALVNQTELKKTLLDVELLNSGSSRYEQDKKEIADIFVEAFSDVGSLSESLEWIFNGNYVLLSRDHETKQIKGFSAVDKVNTKEKPSWSVNVFARKANAAKLGVGKRLMEYVTCLFGNDIPMRLQVRSNNTPAITLYEQFGFKKIYVKPNCYSLPTIDGNVMVRQKDKGT